MTSNPASGPQTFETYRTLLFSIAYRMLGSAMEAEDMVQEAYLRYEAVAAEAIQSPKAYLTTIITRLCLDQLKSARLQRENYVGTWLPEPLLTGPSPSTVVGEYESISMAFLVLLENLSPIERAVFLLREVFEYSYSEIARFVDKSEANCRRYHHRARQFLLERRPRFEPSSDEQKKLVEGFLQAVSSGDVEGLTAMLAEEVAVYGDGGAKVHTSPHPVIGREAAIRLLVGIARLVPAGVSIEIAEVNAAPSLLVWQADNLLYVMNFTIAGGQIREIHNILNPDKLQYLGNHH